MISEAIGAFLSGKRVVPQVPPGRVVVLDGDEDEARSDERSGISPLALFIEYRDAKGTLSARRIACRSFDVSTGRLTAWCFERQALREFRFDRIVSAACTETGEFHDVADLAAMLSEGGLPVRDGGLNLVLRFLVFLMRCDGTHRREMDALEQAVISYALRFDGDDALVDRAMRQARSMAPDEQDFLAGLHVLRRHPDRARLAPFIARQACAIIDADGRISDEEGRFAAELDVVLRRIGEDA